MTPKQKRTEIKRILHLLTDKNREIFKRMYHPTNLDEDIDVVVDAMSAKQLTWALSQCENTYYHIFEMLKT